jgi:glycosyltransferase involved in cell wall biosynthesis
VKFILSSRFTEEVIQNHLGEPESGYYFLLSAFQPVLADLGSVEIVRHPETEVDPIFKACQAQGEFCLFLPFAAPRNVPLDLECPTVPVIAWGFSTIPDAEWDNDPRNDWRFALAKARGAITLSTYSARAIAEAMGPDFMIGVVPVPIRTQTDDALPVEPATVAPEIAPGGAALDTAAMNLRVDLLAPAVRPGGAASGADELGRHTNPRLPAERSTATTRDDLHGTAPTAKSQPGLSARSVVYTTVLNQTDPRKNPYDIVTAFCWAFRDIQDATLVLKVRDHGLHAFYNSLVPILYRLSPFRCRVLVLPGFLPDSEYENLIRATTYYVNASTSEGVCMPLMEFMSFGKPAIAPAHTAMADYIDNDVAFVLRANRQVTTWPHDPRRLFRTMSFRLDWASLLDAYGRSYRLATTMPDEYGEMSKRARDKMRQYASPGNVTGQLRNFFSAVTAATLDLNDDRRPATKILTGRQ